MPVHFYPRNYWYRIQNHSKIFVLKDFAIKPIILGFQIRCVYFQLFAFWNIAKAVLGELHKC